jgi:hypothetical protein
MKEKQIDQLVYKLYNLIEEEIRIIENFTKKQRTIGDKDVYLEQQRLIR